MMAAKETSPTFERLPTFAKPLHYKLHLKTDLDLFTFIGEESIDVEILEPTDYLKLNSLNIKISKADLKIHKDDINLSDLSVSYNIEMETIDIKLPKQIDPGMCTLNIEFQGILNEETHGFYRSKYTDDEGNEKLMVSTQFESTFARFAFPCYDEPIYKATYDITLTVKDKFTALSNMNVVLEEKLDNGWKNVKFAKTPKMSSYLVAFAVGEFNYLEDKTSNGIIVRVYSVRKEVDQLKFALDVACKAHDYYNDFFGIKYPLPKCDLLAVPDFSMGAMENWGLITYREVCLSVDPAKSSTTMKSEIAFITAHELAHMWFGNLATMKWWADLWLKEGFAEYMDYLFVDYAFPEFEIMLRFVNDQMVVGLKADALHNSHEIEIQIENPNELEKIYDDITYNKSSSLVGMLYHYLGHEVFKLGCQHYLNKFQFSNAQTTDLWDSLSQVSGVNVEQLMSDWTKQMGFPVISVQSRQDGDKRVINLSQKRFMADGSDDPKEKLWRIPISICTSDNPSEAKFKVLMDKREQQFTLDNVPEDKWIKLNVGMTGFYRVEYSHEMFNSLLAPLTKRQLHAIDRFNILSDIFALVTAGRADITQFLDLMGACQQDTQLLMWEIIDNGINSISNVLARTDLKERFDKCIQTMYSPIAEKLGWEPKEGESNHTQLLRPLVLFRLGRSGHQVTIDKARKLFKDHVENGTDLNPDLRKIIYCLIGRYDGQEGFESLQKILESSSNFVEVERNCLQALAASPDPIVHQTALEYMMNSGKIRAQDFCIVFIGLCRTRQGQDTGVDFLMKQCKNLVQAFGGANNIVFLDAVQFICRNQCSEQVAVDIESFFAASDYGQTVDRIVKQTCESIRLNASMLKRNKHLIGTWLTKNGY